MTASPIVAVTGATGFLGRHLVAALVREGAHPRILARRPLPSDHWPGLTPEIVPGSLEQPETLERLADGAHAVIHTAGLVAARNRGAFLHANRDGAQAAAAAASRHAPTARFILISSLAARAPGVSDYAASKRAGEEAVRGVYKDRPERLVILRPPAIYGPGDRATLALFQAAARPLVPLFGSGRAAIMHAEDTTAAVARLAMGAGDPGLYSLADTNPGGYHIADILAEAARAANRAPYFVRLPDAALLAAGLASGWWGRLLGGTPIFTIGKAREMLHPDWSVTSDELLPPSVYRAKIGIGEGFRDTVAWYRQAGWLR